MTTYMSSIQYFLYRLRWQRGLLLVCRRRPGHRLHFQSPSSGLISLSHKLSRPIRVQPSFTDFDSLLFLGCNTVVISLYTTVATFKVWTEGRHGGGTR